MRERRMHAVCEADTSKSFSNLPPFHMVGVAKRKAIDRFYANCDVGTFCFMGFRGYGWYLSSTAMFLYFSWIIHNIVAWMKIKPFFVDSNSMFKPQTGKWVRRIYLSTLALTVPFICWQISNNYRFFNNI